MIFDYENASVDEVAAFLYEHRIDLDAPALSAEGVMAELRNANTALERRPWGLAVIQGVGISPFLWLIYVDPQDRGKNHGRKFVREIKTKYAKECAMQLECYGSRRRKFFSRCGFVVIDRDEEGHRTMVG